MTKKEILAKLEILKTKGSSCGESAGELIKKLNKKIFVIPAGE